MVRNRNACKIQGLIQGVAYESRQSQHFLHGSQDQILPQDWVGAPTKFHCVIFLQILRNIDSELSWLLPILASGERIKCQIFVLDKDTEDLIGKPF